jgi:predicted GNAT superfamily acetyltransferase
MKTRPIARSDFPEVLRLNAESVHFLSPLDGGGLANLQQQSPFHRVLESEGQVVAFLIALEQGADYGSPNYRWFAARYEYFLYVDRVVVSSSFQGRGAGALLYRQLFEYAAEHDMPMVCCEFDVAPPNPGSAAFHARFGFAEVARQTIANGAKVVSLQIAHAPFSHGA